jgi:hypothetical protein
LPISRAMRFSACAADPSSNHTTKARAAHHPLSPVDPSAQVIVVRTALHRRVAGVWGLQCDFRQRAMRQGVLKCLWERRRCGH